MSAKSSANNTTGTKLTKANAKRSRPAKTLAPPPSVTLPEHADKWLRDAHTTIADLQSTVSNLEQRLNFMKVDATTKAVTFEQ